MAICVALTKGRKLACAGGIGGIKSIGIAPWTGASQTTIVAGEMTAISGLSSVYIYDVKNNGNVFTETQTSDVETRNIMYEDVLTAILQKYDLATKQELALLSLGEVYLFIETYNGDIFSIGANFGANLITSAFASGGARADMVGWTLTFNSFDIIPFQALSTACKVQYASKSVLGA